MYNILLFFFRSFENTFYRMVRIFLRNIFDVTINPGVDIESDKESGLL